MQIQSRYPRGRCRGHRKAVEERHRELGRVLVHGRGVEGHEHVGLAVHEVAGRTLSGVPVVADRELFAGGCGHLRGVVVAHPVAQLRFQFPGGEIHRSYAYLPNRRKLLTKQVVKFTGVTRICRTEENY